MNPMNILFVVPYVPDKIRVRPYNLIRHLAQLGHRITLLTVWTKDEELLALQQMQAICEQVKAVNLPAWRSLLNCLLVLPTSRPLQTAYSWEASLANDLFELASGKNGGSSYHVVHIEHLRGAQYGVDLKTRLAGCKLDIPVVWDSVDAISLLFRQAMVHSKSAFNRGVTRFELGRTEKYEAWLLDRFERVLVTSELDRRALLSLEEGNGAASCLEVLPNGVDLDYFSPGDESGREDKTVVLSGKMSYHANLTMAMDFIQRIMPRVWSRDPQVKICIVGKDPPPSLQALDQNPNIQVTGTVEDMRPYLKRAAVAAAPIAYGVGIQNKVLEAMACGTPLIASPQAVSALDAKPGQEVIVAGDDPSFAENILELLADPQRRFDLGQAGRRYVEKNHDWSRIAVQLQEIYQAAGQKILTG
jgi:sugar transferase (PEP-CTERM/EpsH1 system associated)